MDSRSRFRYVEDERTDLVVEEAGRLAGSLCMQPVGSGIETASQESVEASLQYHLP